MRREEIVTEELVRANVYGRSPDRLRSAHHGQEVNAICDVLTPLPSLLEARALVLAALTECNPEAHMDGRKALELADRAFARLSAMAEEI